MLVDLGRGQVGNVRFTVMVKALEESILVCRVL